ncbi:class I SAM-dependent methyltransferase [Chloroflexi bacterium TSY]|nr:class I SAM-dependent methyltransferase [Chloroflexi bacterium TSY]
MIDNQKLEKTRQFWNQEAAHFDNEPDHGLLDPKVYEAWRRLLSAYVPSTPATILDIGCGTGSLSVLLSQLGHDVTGIDLFQL